MIANKSSIGLTDIPAWIVRFILAIGHLFLTLIGSILGLFIVSILVLFKAWEPDTAYVTGRPIQNWKMRWWTYPWSNQEDGVIAPEFVNGVAYMPGKSDRLRAWAWSAWRNKVSNLRFMRPLAANLDPSKIKWIGNNTNLYNPLPAGTTNIQWSLAWQGMYWGLWIAKPGSKQLRFGWTIIPADSDPNFEYKPDDIRHVWCGFSFQFNAAG